MSKSTIYEDIGDNEVYRGYLDEVADIAVQVRVRGYDACSQARLLA